MSQTLQWQTFDKFYRIIFFLLLALYSCTPRKLKCIFANVQCEKVVNTDHADISTFNFFAGAQYLQIALKIMLTRLINWKPQRQNSATALNPMIEINDGEGKITTHNLYQIVFLFLTSIGRFQICIFLHQTPHLTPHLWIQNAYSPTIKSDHL